MRIVSRCRRRPPPTDARPSTETRVYDSGSHEHRAKTWARCHVCAGVYVCVCVCVWLVYACVVMMKMHLGRGVCSWRALEGAPLPANTVLAVMSDS